MIAKESTRVASSSFSRLAAYVADLKKIGDLRDWQKTADYILDRKEGGQRVDAIRVTNCDNEEAGLALAEIAAVQECNTSSKADKTFHLIVSFPPGEMPSPAQLHDIEDRLCAAIGLADHQRISAVHNDKAHFHFHVAINKVNPSTLRNVTPYFSQARLQAACIELEKKHGLTPTNHQMPVRGSRRLSKRAEAMELQGKQQSLIQWVRDQAGPVLLAAQETGKSWQDIHHAAASFGLELKPRGAGLMIAVVGEKYARVKPSDIDRRLSFGPLTQKWGEYQAPRGPQPALQQVYPSAPLQIRHPKAAALYKAFKQDRERFGEQRKTERISAHAISMAYRAELAAWSRARRDAIKGMPYMPQARRAAYAEVKQLRDEAYKREKERVAEERKASRLHPLPNWQSWLEAQAAGGNPVALEVLRAGEQKKTTLGEALLAAETADQAKHVVYQHLTPTIGRDGTVTYHVADGGRVTDRSGQVSVDATSPAAVFLALTLAAERFATPLLINGTDEFKQQLLRLAAVEGVYVTFADPAMEAERQRQVADRQARQDQQPGRSPITHDRSVRTEQSPEQAQDRSGR